MKKYTVIWIMLLSVSSLVEAKRPTLFSTPYRKDKIKKAIRWGKELKGCKR